ncbi:MULTISPECIES: hypothetical protein [unclassified Frankia]
MDTTSAVEGCFSCLGNASLDGLPPRERILVDPGWRVTHTIRTALPGWLVVVARRHVTTMAELTAAEAAEWVSPTVMDDLAARLTASLAAASE